MIKKPKYDIMNPGRGNGINIFFAGSGFDHKLAYDCGVRKRLISWHANSLSEIDELKTYCENNDDVFAIIDSGAFTVWNKGGTINVYTYGIKLLEYLQAFDIAANLDVIPGKKGMAASDITKQMTDDAASQGLENFVTLKQIMKSNGCEEFANRIMPIYHQGEDIDWLRKMIDHGCEYIGISPSNDYHTNQRMFWLDDVFNYLGDLQSMPMTHGYAVTSKTLMQCYPWFSVDSSSWIQSGGVGTVFTPYGNITLSDRPEVMGKADAWDGSQWTDEMRDLISSYFNSLGLSLETLRSKYRERWKANAYFFLNYEKSYKYSPKPKNGLLFS